MQGVPAHLEYLKNNKAKERKVNCTFCIYLIPIMKENKRNEVKNNKNIFDVRKSKDYKNAIKINKVSEIISIYFINNIETKTKVNDKYYRIIGMYNKEKDYYIEEIFYGDLANEIVVRVRFNLRNIIEIVNNKIMFTIKIEDIVNSLKIDGNNSIAKYLIKEEISNIIRTADVDNSKEIKNKIEAIIKYIGYIIIKYFDNDHYSRYKVSNQNINNITSGEKISENDVNEAYRNALMVYRDIRNEKEAFLFFASMNLINSYVKKDYANKSLMNNYTFEEYVSEGIEQVIMNDIKGVDIYFADNLVYIKLMNYQFSFHNVYSTNIIEKYKKSSKNKYQKWSGKRLQLIAVSIFNEAKAKCP